MWNSAKSHYAIGHNLHVLYVHWVRDEPLTNQIHCFCIEFEEKTPQKKRQIDQKLWKRLSTSDCVLCDSPSSPSSALRWSWTNHRNFHKAHMRQSFRTFTESCLPTRWRQSNRSHCGHAGCTLIWKLKIAFRTIHYAFISKRGPSRGFRTVIPFRATEASVCLSDVPFFGFYDNATVQTSVRQWQWDN